MCDTDRQKEISFKFKIEYNSRKKKVTLLTVGDLLLNLYQITKQGTNCFPALTII